MMILNKGKYEKKLSQMFQMFTHFTPSYDCLSARALTVIISDTCLQLPAFFTPFYPPTQKTAGFTRG